MASAQNTRPEFILFKSTRRYTSGPGYAGPSCALAGVEPARRYASLAEAEADRINLNAVNPVGFMVVRFKSA